MFAARGLSRYALRPHQLVGRGELPERLKGLPC